MSNTIQDELELAKSKMIEEVIFQGKTLAKLTRDNVAIVEAMIRNDSAYIRSCEIWRFICILDVSVEKSSD